MWLRNLLCRFRYVAAPMEPMFWQPCGEEICTSLTLFCISDCSFLGSAILFQLFRLLKDQQQGPAELENVLCSNSPQISMKCFLKLTLECSALEMKHLQFVYSDAQKAWQVSFISERMRSIDTLETDYNIDFHLQDRIYPLDYDLWGKNRWRMMLHC